MGLCLKGEIGCQRILTSIWTGLCGYLLPGSENDMCRSTSHFTSWTSRMPFSMVFLMRRFTWSNH